MAYNLSDINSRAKLDPKAFIEECDEVYQDKINQTAKRITENLKNSPIVLLSGPSGSGKTTTAMKIADELAALGIKSHSVGLDNYFKTIDPKTAPRTPEGDLDLESPKCLDMELLNEHFTLLSKGERVYVPKYEFSRQIRKQDPWKSLRLGQDEVAIFEGIHALNDDITCVHPEAFMLYISARSNIEDNGELVFKGTWMRLLRRTVRDNKFRGSDASSTLRMWENVRRGEKAYISPFKEKASYKLDTAFPYEVSVLKHHAKILLKTIPQGATRYDEIASILPALERFEDIDEDLLAPEAMLREFVGGGVYDY